MNESRASLTRIKERDDIHPQDITETRQALLAALSKVSGDAQSGFQPEEPDNHDNTYYTLTAEEMEALVNGDIETIESWVSNLDERQATRLFYWLQKEDW